MTDYGLIVRNTNNQIQIDSTYKNHIYKQHGSSSVNQYLNIISINYVSTGAIFFLKTPADGTIYVSPYGFILDSTSNVYTDIIIASSGSGTVDWIVYDQIETTQDGNYGLNVYDSSSSLVFSSLETGYVNIINDRTVGTGYTAVRNNFKNYYAITPGLKKYAYSDCPGTGIIERYIYMFQRAGTGAEVIDIGGHVYHRETNWDCGAYSGGGGASSSSLPQHLIEIKPPPGI